MTVISVLRIQDSEVVHMCRERTAIAGHPPLALRLRSVSPIPVLTGTSNSSYTGIPEDHWAEVVAESGFVDPHSLLLGTGPGVEGKAYFARSTVGASRKAGIRGPHGALLV